MKAGAWSSVIVGAEYEDTDIRHREYDIPCAVCWVRHSTAIMVPATHTCPTGWTTQYRGHLHGQYRGYYPSQYLCLDDKMEHNSVKAIDDDGCIFYTAAMRCISLNCPPFNDTLVLTCVVCSK